MSFLVRLPAEQYQKDAFDGFTPGAFTLLNARACAWLAQIAYEDDDQKIDGIIAPDKWNLTRIASFKPLAASTLPMWRTRGYVFAGRGAHFVVFTGTDPLVLTDWVSDFDFPLDGGDIHRGFAAALDAAWEQIVTALRAAAPMTRLLFVGHSLGAALAVLGAKRALDSGEVSAPVEAVYTFGMPRAGGPQFALGYEAALGARTYRLVHGDDIVPTVPPAALGFAHVGRLLTCPRQRRFDAAMLETAPSNEPTFARGLLGGFQQGLVTLVSDPLGQQIRPDLIGQASRFLPPPIADHLPDRYWHALDPHA